MEMLTKKGCCTIGSKGAYYCVRCNWSGDHPEEPREKESWHCCPVCRGHAIPRSRKTGEKKHGKACSC